MTIYKFTTTATHKDFGTEIVEEYLASYGYDHAKQHIITRLEKAGWKVEKINGKSIFFEDIRDSCDHTTDTI